VDGCSIALDAFEVGVFDGTVSLSRNDAVEFLVGAFGDAVGLNLCGKLASANNSDAPDSVFRCFPGGFCEFLNHPIHLAAGCGIDLNLYVH
jgi:hypothetical protein